MAPLLQRRFFYITCGHQDIFGTDYVKPRKEKYTMRHEGPERRVR